jgi:hypothetical protein
MAQEKAVQKQSVQAEHKTQKLVCWLLGTSVRKTNRFLRTDVPSSQHSFLLMF